MEKQYNHTFQLLIAILAIVAFIVSTADFVVEKSVNPNNVIYLNESEAPTEQRKQNIENIFYEISIPFAVLFIIIFFLLIINRNFLINIMRVKWILKITDIISIILVLWLFIMYIHWAYNIWWLGYLYLDSTICKGRILCSNPGHYIQFIMGIFIWVLLSIYLIISALNLLDKARRFKKEILKKIKKK